MGTITLKEARRRSGLDLISDKGLSFYDPLFGSGEVRDGQKKMERWYGRHDVIRESATKYFLERDYDVYPRGITVDGIGTCPDFAFFRKRKLTFVECLTEGWVYRWNTLKKRRVEKFAPIVFVVEDKPSDEFTKPYQKRDYFNRVRRLATKCDVFWCNMETRQIKRFDEK